MTLEEKSFDSDWEYSGKQRIFNRIMWRIREQALPGAPHVEQYFQNLRRRNISVHTLKTAFTTIQSFLEFLRKHGKPHLSSLIQEDLEAFVESQQDRGLKPLSVKNNLRQVQTFLRYLIARGIVPSNVLARPIRIKVPEALPRAMDPPSQDRLDVFRVVSDIAPKPPMRPLETFSFLELPNQNTYWSYLALTIRPYL